MKDKDLKSFTTEQLLNEVERRLHAGFHKISTDTLLKELRIRYQADKPTKEERK